MNNLLLNYYYSAERQIPKQHVKRMTDILESTECALGKCECASPHDIPKDNRIVLSEFFGLLLLSFTPYGLSTGLTGVFRGLKESHGDALKTIACAIHQGSIGAESGVGNGINQFNRIMNKGNSKQ